MNMRVSLLLLASFFIGFSSWSQTVGNGITATNFEIADGQLSFDPTTVGTQASHDLLITNLVGVSQQIVFNGLAAPFSLSTDTLDLDAQQAQVVTLYFDPEAVGSFDDESFLRAPSLGRAPFPCLAKERKSTSKPTATFCSLTPLPSARSAQPH